jgi:hypothetical protein
MIERFLHGLREKMQDPDHATAMTVILPGDMDPLDRHYGLSAWLDAELRLDGLGCSNGGGTLYLEAPDGEPETCVCIIDVDATDIDGARALLRLHLPELGAPVGTMVQWHALEDSFDGTRWRLAEPRSLDHLEP